MKIKTSELTGPALDWVVIFARCLDANNGRVIQARDLAHIALKNGPALDFEALIEREGINIFRYNKLDPEAPWVWCAHKIVVKPDWRGSPLNMAISRDGTTPREAAFRCFVASKLGDEVDVPEELL